jgi:hypothetical protein
VVRALVHRDGFVGRVDSRAVVDHDVRPADVERVVGDRVRRVALLRRTFAGLEEGLVAVAGRDRQVADDDVVAARLDRAAHDDDGRRRGFAGDRDVRADRQPRLRIPAVAVGVPVLGRRAAEEDLSADVEHDRARLLVREVFVVQAVAERPLGVVGVAFVELGDVVDDAAATAGDVHRGAVGAGEGGDFRVGSARRRGSEA